MRISLQLRMGDDQGEASRERWQRSVYVDTSDQERTIYFDDLTPVGETHTLRPRVPGDSQRAVRRRRHEHEAGGFGPDLDRGGAAAITGHTLILSLSKHELVVNAHHELMSRQGSTSDARSGP